MHGVYVRNLPQEHLAVEVLEAEFSKYGQLKTRDTAPINKQAVMIHNTTKDGKVRECGSASLICSRPAYFCGLHVAMFNTPAQDMPCRFS